VVVVVVIIIIIIILFTSKEHIFTVLNIRNGAEVCVCVSAHRHELFKHIIRVLLGFRFHFLHVTCLAIAEL